MSNIYRRLEFNVEKEGRLHIWQKKILIIKSTDNTCDISYFDTTIFWYFVLI